MIFKFRSLKLDITKNKINSFWKPRGMYVNHSAIKRDGTWYKCSISFRTEQDKVFMSVSDVMLTNDRGVIKYHEQGLYKEFVVSHFKKNLIELLLNRHRINYKWYRFRSTVYDRRNTITVFGVSILLAVVYYIGNEYFNNSWAEYVTGNSTIQALFILLNIFSIGSIFFPFTIQKQISEDDIRRIIKSEDHIKKGNEEAIRRSTL